MDKESLYRQVFTSFKNLCAIGEQPSSFSKYCSDHGVNPNLMPIIVKGEYQNIRTLPGYRFRRDIHSVGARYMEIYENFRELCAQGRQPGTFRDYCAGFGVNRDQMHSYLRRNHLKVAGLPGYDGPAGVGVPHCRDIPFEEICGGDEDFYRNKAQYPVAEQNGKLICGFYSKRSHRVVPFTDCRLQPEIFGKITEECLKFANEKKIPAYIEENGSGVLRHIYIRRGFHSGEIMVCFVVKNKSRLSDFSDIARKVADKFPDVKSVVINVNPKITNVILGTENITLFGSDEITDILCEKKITLSPMSFYQVNTAQAEKLYRCGMDYAELTGSETVLDLYCGAGTIGLTFSDKAQKIIGCEIVPEAIENAKRNAELNGVRNAEFYCGDAGELAAKLADEGTVPDVAVIDPPRKGCGKLTLDSLIKMSPKKIVMISCNPATAARDTKYLADNGYEIKRARAFDLFPRTGHVETVVLLSKGEIELRKVKVEFSLEDMDMSGFQKGATYGQIKKYVKEQTGLSVSSLYIAQVKQKCGIIERENYNKAKSDGAKQPKCPPDKERAIMEALEHFRMI